MYSKNGGYRQILIYSTLMLQLRDAESQPTAGIVTILDRAFNQRDVLLVASCKLSGLQREKLA